MSSVTCLLSFCFVYTLSYLSLQFMLICEQKFSIQIHYRTNTWVAVVGFMF